MEPKTVEDIINKYYQYRDKLEILNKKLEKIININPDFVQLVKDILYYKNCSYREFNHPSYAKLLDKYSKDDLEKCQLHFNPNHSTIHTTIYKGYNTFNISLELKYANKEYLKNIKDDLKVQEQLAIDKGKKIEKENNDLINKNKIDLLSKVDLAIININKILSSSGKSEKYTLTYDDDYIYLISVNGTEEKMRLYRIRPATSIGYTGLIEREDDNPFVSVSKKAYEKFNRLFKKEKINIIK